MAILLLSVHSAFCATRLAILADEQAQPAADLLTTKLSKDENLVLIERAEIDKVLQELKLSASGDLQHDLSLASQLHADGIVILESRKVADKPVVGARLVASAPGVVIGAGLFGGPPDALADSVAAHFDPLWPKLTVARDSAIPVSLLNLRCALKGSEALESQLTFLLAHQLMQQPAIFVLERWRMDDLALEKGLGEWTAGAFWTAGYVVDGRIDEEKDGKLKVVIFLQPPKGGGKQEIEVSGTIQDLRQIADEITSRITKALSKQPIKSEWKSGEEGKQYLNEARWALEARLFSAAHSAIEASWALGDRDPDVFCLRSEIYSALAFPPATREPRGNARATPEHPFHWGYDPDAIDVSLSDKYLQATLFSMECFKEYAALHPVRGVKDDEIHAGTMVLQAASRVARNYFDRGLIAGPNAEPLAELRRKIRETADIVTGLDEHPVWRNGKGEPLYTHNSDGVKAFYLPFWYDTRAAATEAYRELFKKHPGRLLDSFAARHWLQSYVSENYGVPWLVGWNGETAAELDKTWAGFLDLLEASSDVRDVLNGSLLKVANAKTRWEKEAASASFCELIWKRRDEVFQTDYKGYFRCFPEIVVPDPQPYRVRWLEYYLQNSAAFDYDAIGYFWRAGDIESADKAREILQRLQDFQSRLSANGKLTNVARDRIAEFGTHLIEKFPEVAPAGKSSSQTVTVTRLWLPDATEGKLSHCVAWCDDKLWVAFSRELPAKEGEKPRYSVKICALKIPSFAVDQSIKTPEDITLTGIFRGPDFYVTPTSVFLRDRSQFHRYDRKEGAWTSFSFPDRGYSAVFARGDELFAGFSGTGGTGESGILKWSAVTGTVEVVASNRRRPGLHAFDDCPAYDVESICGGPDGKFGVKISKFYWYKPGSKEWEMPLPPATSAPSVVIPVGNFHLMISRKCGVLAIDNESGKMTPLPGSHFEAPAVNPVAVYLPEAFLPDYAPTGTAVNPTGTAYENGRLWTVRMRNDGVGQSLVLNRTERLDQPTSPSGDAGLVFKPSTDKTGQTAGVSMNSIDARHIEMAATDQGLVMRIPGTEGFWFISNEDFDAALAASAKTSNSK